MQVPSDKSEGKRKYSKTLSSCLALAIMLVTRRVFHLRSLESSTPTKYLWCLFMVHFSFVRDLPRFLFIALCTLGPVHATREQFKNATITGHLGFLFEESSVREITWFSSVTPSFSKRSVLKCFPSTRKRKVCVFKSLRLEERFRKAPFS